MAPPSMRSPWLPLLAFLAALLSTTGALAAPRSMKEDALRRSAQALYGRVLAPCCWTQTLDVHESDTVTGLRREIMDRLRAGDSPPAIEDVLAARYGERIRAVPRGNDTRQYVGITVMSLLVLTLLGLGWLGHRWVGRSGTTDPPDSPELSAQQADSDARYDDQLKRELDALELKG